MARTKVAFVKDWLTSWGGSEDQLLQLLERFPTAPVYTSVYDRERLPQFAKYDIHTMRVPRWFAGGRRFELLALLLPSYFNRLQINADVVVSITSGFAKAAHAVAPGKHLSICNTPLRFAWSFGGDDRGRLSQLFAPWFRRFDVTSADSVDLFLANSRNVQERIKRCYGRESEVLYPPVNTEAFRRVRRTKKPRGFVTLSRLVAYKRIDLIVQACTELNVELTVIGTGPEEESLKRLAGPTVRFLGFADRERVLQEYAQAEGYIFAANEDFGISPVEAMASGLPVIAYRAGGALETVKEGVSGLFFNEQSVVSLKRAISRFRHHGFKSDECRAWAAQFDQAVFVRQAEEKIHSFIP